jgi:CRISPR-associated endonuclease/helicase Cas3
LTGFSPVPWQRELYTRFAEGRPPRAVPLPTGLGKTMVMAVWLIARAAGAPVPRRLVYIVDRRAIVDAATALADEFADRLTPKTIASLSDEDRTVLTELKAGLGLDGDEMLPVSTLRGQYTDDGSWWRDLTRPAIIVGTVDMAGSRLLFSGYTVSRWMRPVHAALLGMDSLIVLDESHLVPPFAHLLADLREEALPGTEELPVQPFRVLSLSATGRDTQDALALSRESRQHPWVARRLAAPKRLGLRRTDTKGLAEAMAERALELAGETGRVVVFCDRFDEVNKVVALLNKAMDGRNKALRKEDKDYEVQPHVVQLTGRIRVRERSSLSVDPVFRRFSDSMNGEGPAFLVATSAGEVGVDLDADHMICDLVAWERMVQRLGRVNRAGRKTPATVEIFAAQANSVDDVRYAELLAPFEHEAWPTDADGRRDASPGALTSLMDDDDFEAIAKVATTPEPFRPPLNRPLLDAWAMTSVERHAARPDVAPWLRGWTDDTPEAAVVWRKFLPPQDEAPRYVEAARPHVYEMLTAPSYTIEAWVKEVAARVSKARSGVRKALRDRYAEEPARLAAIVIRRDVPIPLTVEKLEAAAARRRLLQPGDTLIIDARFAGLTESGTLDPRADHIPPVWDEMAGSGREGTGSPATVAEARQPFDGSEGADPVIPRRFVLRKVSSRTGSRDWKIGDYAVPVDPEAEEPTEHRVEVRTDRGDRAVAGRKQSLDEHHEWTAEAARELCDRVALPAALAEAMIAVSRHHDLGKDRSLWKAAMGVPDGETLAKTTGRRLLRSLDGYRHEYGSLRDLSEGNYLCALSEEMRDLALHLVTAHHGRGRPWINAFDPDAAPPLDANIPRMDQGAQTDAALRFDRLQRRYGHYGLAWLETVMRTADWIASDRNDQAGAA